MEEIKKDGEVASVDSVEDTDRQELPRGADSEDSEKGEGSQEVKPSGDDRLANLEKRLRDTQASFHRVSQERSELQKKLAELEVRLAQISESRAPAEDPLAFLDDPSFDEKFLAKPQEMVKKLVGAISVGLAGIDHRFSRQLDELRREMRRPPESVRAAVEELRREHPELEDLPDDKLAVVAQIVAKKSSEGSEASSKKEWPGGSTVRRRAEASHGSDQVDPMVRRMFERIYGS